MKIQFIVCGWWYDEWDGKNVRLVTAWNTDPKDIDTFLDIIKS